MGVFGELGPLPPIPHTIDDCDAGPLHSSRDCFAVSHCKLSMYGSQGTMSPVEGPKVVGEPLAALKLQDTTMKPLCTRRVSTSLAVSVFVARLGTTCGHVIDSERFQFAVARHTNGALSRKAALLPNLLCMATRFTFEALASRDTAAQMHKVWLYHFHAKTLRAFAEVMGGSFNPIHLGHALLVRAPGVLALPASLQASAVLVRLLQSDNPHCTRCRPGLDEFCQSTCVPNRAGAITKKY